MRAESSGRSGLNGAKASIVAPQSRDTEPLDDYTTAFGLNVAHHSRLRRLLNDWKQLVAKYTRNAFVRHRDFAALLFVSH